MARALSGLIAVAIAAACAGALTMTAGPASAQQKKQYANGEKPLKGVIRYRRPGGYSYKKSDTMGRPVAFGSSSIRRVRARRVRSTPASSSIPPLVRMAAKRPIRTSSA